MPYTNKKQKVANGDAKGHLSEGKRPSFAVQKDAFYNAKGTKLTEKAWRKGLNRHQKA